MRLDKFLCEMNIGTRSEVKAIISAGRVMVGGVCERNPATHVSEEDIVSLDGNELKYEEYRYYMLNKPAGVVSATTDEHDRTVLDILNGENLRDMFPVGRLDKDTEGLLLITNDGVLSHNLLSPKKHVDKCYYVELADKITKDDIKQLIEGVDIGDDELTHPAKVSALTPKSIYLTITEGRYHQVKRMMQAVGNEVTYLKRVSFGPLELDSNLPVGSYRRLEDDEVMMLKIKSN